MKIGIIGAGNLALALARRLVAGGHEVLLSSCRGPASLRGPVSELGDSAAAVTVAEAAKAEWCVLALPWTEVEGVLTALPDWNGRILIDTTNHFLPTYDLADLQGRVSSEIVAGFAPGARVVKALNTLCPLKLAADPLVPGGRRAVFISGDDEEAKVQVEALFESFGFAVVDLGSLGTGGRVQQIGEPLAAEDFVVCC